MVELAGLRLTTIGALVSDDYREDALTVSKRVSSMKSGGTADMQLVAATPFWMQVQSRVHWFFQFKLASDTAHVAGSIMKFAAKTIRGMTALDSALKLLERDAKEGRAWELKALQGLRPWVHTFDEVHVRLYTDGVKDSVAKSGWKVDGMSLSKPLATVAIEDTHEGGVMVASASSSSASYAASLLPPDLLTTTPEGKRAVKKSKGELSREMLRSKVMQTLNGSAA